MPRKHLLIRTCSECQCKFETKHLHQETCSRKCGITLLRRRERAEHERDGVTQVWACGGGVQSAGIAALIYTHKLPPPTYAWMVDVGYEPQSTFDYMLNVIIPKLKEVNVNVNIIRTVDYSDNKIWDDRGFIRIPLYEKIGDRIAKYKTRCNGTWKVQVAHKWLREQGVQRCDTWLGISLDEKRRAKKTNNVKWNQIKYPLIDLNISREDCIYLLGNLGWPKPEHTSCYICPLQSDAQWQKLKKHYPDDWNHAVEIDNQLRGINPNIYLHNSCVPLEDAALK